MMHRENPNSNLQPTSPPIDRNKYSLFSSGLQARLTSDGSEQSAHQATNNMRSKSSMASANRRPGSANRSRNVRLSTSAKRDTHEDNTYMHMEREDLVHTVIELKKQLNTIEAQNSQLKADNQRLDGEVTKQQHRIDKIMAPQFAKNGHLVVEIRKEIEKSVLVRQLKAQILSLRQVINEKTSHMEALQKRMNATHLVEMMTEKEEFYAETLRLRQIVGEQENELRRLRHASLNGNNDIEADLRNEIDRLSVGYAEVLHKLENARPATANTATKPTRSSSRKRPQSASLTRSRLTKEVENSRTPDLAKQKSDATPTIQPDMHKQQQPLDATLQTKLGDESLPSNRTATYSSPQLQSPHPLTSPRPPFAVGDTVEGNFRNEGIWFVGVIRSAGSSGFNVAYNDGDYEENVPLTRLRAVGSITPASEAMPLVEEPAYHVGDRIEGRFGNGSDWFIGTVDAVNGNKYSVRFDDGDYEANIPENRLRKLPPSPIKHKSVAATPTPPTASTSAPNAAFKVNDKVLAKYRGLAREYPGVIAKVHKNNSYDINYDDGERETNVAAELIRLQQPEAAAITAAMYTKGMKVLANYKEYDTWYPATIMRATANASGTVYYDIIYDFGETESVTEQFIKHEAPDSDTFPIESRVSANYKREGTWYNGKVHAKHNNGYTIHYDDGDVEHDVQPENMKSLEPIEQATAVAKEEPVPQYRSGDAVLANYRKKGTFLPAVVTRVNRNNTYDITYDDEKVEYDVSHTNIRAAEATPPPANASPPRRKLSQSSNNSAEVTPRTASRKGIGWSLVKTAFMKPPAGGGGDNAPLAVNQSIIARYRREPEWIPGTVIHKRLAGKAFDILYENGEKEYGVPREFIRTLENSTVDATVNQVPETYPEYKVHDKVYGRYLGKGKWMPGVVVYVRKFDGSYDVEYELPYTPYQDIEKKVKPQYLKYREEEPQISLPNAPTADVSNVTTPQDKPLERSSSGNGSSRNVTFSGIDNIKHIEANASPTSVGAAAEAGEAGFDNDLDDFLANLSDDDDGDLDYGGLKSEKAVMLDENELETEEREEEGYYDDFES